MSDFEYKQSKLGEMPTGTGGSFEFENLKLSEPEDTRRTGIITFGMTINGQTITFGSGHTFGEPVRFNYPADFEYNTDKLRKF